MYEKLQLPNSCLIDKTVFKKLFLDNCDLTTDDKKTLSEIISKVIWKYSLKKDNFYVKPYQDEEREYTEIELMEVEVSRKTKEKRIAEMVMRAIPYPMLLILKCGEEWQLWTGHQRNSLNDHDKNVVEELVNSPWLWEEAILEILQFPAFKKTNFYVLYTEIQDAISKYNVRDIAVEDVGGAEARAMLAHKEAVEARLASLRAQLKKETQFNRKVELNMEIRRLEKG